MKRIYWIIAGVTTLIITGGIMTRITIKNITKTLKKHSIKRFRKRALGRITGIVIHHAAIDGFDARDYADWHVAKGWPGIGYHYEIRPDGTINQTNHLTTISYHCKGYNTSTIGVILNGDFTKRPPTPAQISSAIKLVKKLKRDLPNIGFVKGHGELRATKCPGRCMNMDSFRRKLNF